MKNVEMMISSEQRERSASLPREEQDYTVIKLINAFNIHDMYIIHTYINMSICLFDSSVVMGHGL